MRKKIYLYFIYKYFLWISPSHYIVFFNQALTLIHHHRSLPLSPPSDGATPLKSGPEVFALTGGGLCELSRQYLLHLFNLIDGAGFTASQASWQIVAGGLERAEADIRLEALRERWRCTNRSMRLTHLLEALTSAGRHASSQYLK